MNVLHATFNAITTLHTFVLLFNLSLTQFKHRILEIIRIINIALQAFKHIHNKIFLI